MYRKRKRRLHLVEDAPHFLPAAQLAIEREKAVEGPSLEVFVLKQQQKCQTCYNITITQLLENVVSWCNLVTTEEMFAIRDSSTATSEIATWSRLHRNFLKLLNGIFN